MFEADGESRKSKPGALFESVVLSAAAIAFGCIAFADFLNHSFKASDQVSVAAIQQHGVDYSATGSIVPLRGAQGVNPCMKN